MLTRAKEKIPMANATSVSVNAPRAHALEGRKRPEAWNERGRQEGIRIREGGRLLEDMAPRVNNQLV